MTRDPRPCATPRRMRKDKARCCSSALRLSRRWMRGSLPLALVTLPADRLDVVAVPKPIGRQVGGLDVVDLFSGDREPRFFAGTAQRLASEDFGAPSSIAAVPSQAADCFGLDCHLPVIFMRN